MNITYLLASLAGVGLLVGLNVLLMRGRESAVELTTLSKRLGDEVPGFRAGAIAIAGGGGVALCENAADGAIYLAVRKGDGVVTRKLAHGMRLQRNAATLTFGFADFTFPKASVAFDDERAAVEWDARISRATG